MVLFPFVYVIVCPDTDSPFMYVEFICWPAESCVAFVAAPAFATLFTVTVLVVPFPLMIVKVALLLVIPVMVFFIPVAKSLSV